MTATPDPAAEATPEPASAASIRTAIVTGARLDAAHVRVEVQDGAVVLTGTVASAAAKHQAGRVARATAGVTSVENRLSTVVR